MLKIKALEVKIMDLKMPKAYQRAVKRIKSASTENKNMAMQIVNLMSAQNMTSCNAEMILNLCHDLIEINSQILPIK